MSETQPANNEQDKSPDAESKSDTQPGGVTVAFNSLWWRAYARYPNLIPSPHPEDEEYARNKDAQQNELSRIPDGQDVSLGCVWVCEVYGPAEIEQLYSALSKLGWDQAPSLSDRNTVNWIKRQRFYGSEGVTNIGIIHRGKETQDGFMNRYNPSIPKEFDGLIANVYQVSPSLSCLVLGFFLSEEHSKNYANILNKEFKTSKHPIKGSRSVRIKGVEHNKREALVDRRLYYRTKAIGWVAEQIPGFFALSNISDRMPTGELVLPEGYVSYKKLDDERNTRLHWASFLDLDRPFDVWINSSCPPLRFAFGQREMEDLDHIVVSLTWDTLSEDDLKHRSGESLASKTFFVHENFSGIWAKYSAISFLKEIRRSLAELRESLKTSDAQSDGSLVKLNSIERFLANSIGTATIARELLKLSQNEISFKWNASGYELRSAFEKDKNKPWDISSGLRLMLKRSAARVIVEDQETRQYLDQYSSVLGTRESVKAQRKMERLTVLAIVISLTSLVVAMIAFLSGGG